jgi:TolA-binding protein
MDEWKRHNQGARRPFERRAAKWALPAAVLAAAFLIAASPAKAAGEEMKVSMDLNRVADDTKFENALQFYNLRDEHRALQEFHEYLEIFLNGAHRNEAYRYIARIHFDRFEYDKSVRAYSAIYEDSTGTEEGVEAYYRAAICYQKMGDGLQAHRIYQSIIEQYPYSNFAYLSKIQMDLMKIIAEK